MNKIMVVSGDVSFTPVSSGARLNAGVQPGAQSCPTGRMFECEERPNLVKSSSDLPM